MNRFFALSILIILLFSGPAFADYAKWKLLAEQGDAEAQHNLGLIYQNGIGIASDYDTAIKWFKSAAEQRYAESSYHLGLMYFSGNYGVTQDYILAHMWWNISASQDNKAAGYIRDRLQKKMTATQVEKAQDLARECLARNYMDC